MVCRDMFLHQITGQDNASSPILGQVEARQPGMPRPPFKEGTSMVKLKCPNMSTHHSLNFTPMAGSSWAHHRLRR